MNGNTTPNEYAVPSEPPFVQVSPEASFWSEQAILRTVTIDEVVAKLDENQPNWRDEQAPRREV